MSEPFNKPGYSVNLVILHTLRFAALYLILIGYYLYFRSLVSPLFWTLAFGLGGAAALLTARRFRFVPALGLFALGAGGFRLIAFLFFRVAGDRGDFFYPAFDTNFIPLLLPLGVVWLFTYTALRHRRFILWEAALNGWFLLLLFWSQGRYNLTLLSHPVLLAGGTALFLFIEVTILFIHSSLEGFPDKKRLVLFNLLFLVLLVGGSFLFLGRYSRGAVSRGGGLVQPTLFRFDFSRYIQLESEITMSSDLVLLYREETPVDQRLLRRYVLSGYKAGSGFFLSDPPGEPPQPSSLPDRRTDLPDPDYWGRMDALQEYFFVNFDPSSLVALNYPVEVIPLKKWEASPFIKSYRVRSRVTGFLAWELLETEARLMEPDLQSYYTDYGGDERVKALAESVAGDLENYFDRVTAVQNYLLDNYYYSLKPGVALDGDQLHHFLFESQKGYCSYFAFSMALMCRSLGIPARVAVGFFVDPSLGVMNIYPVRADMAHAWVEVFFPDYGWISFDPTSQTPAPGEDLDFGGLDLARFLDLVEEILANRSLMQEDSPDEEQPAEEEGWGSYLRNLLKRTGNVWYILLPALYLIFLAVRWLMPVLLMKTSSEPRRRMAFLYQILRRELNLIAFSRLRGESFMEWAARLEQAGAAGMEPFMTLYLKSLYGETFSSAGFRAALAYRRKIYRKIRPRFFLPAAGRFLVQPLRRYP